MRESRVGSRQAGGEEGFALVLAILSLMLLTFLGLTLAATTSTELQIAANYRWSQQALYNAEAGVEAGKALLAAMNWSAILPAARMNVPLTAAPADETACGTTVPCWSGATNPSGAGVGTTPPFTGRSDAWGNPSRNFENWQCDQRGNGVGYGVVLDDGTSSAPYQYVNNVFGQQLNGAFTLWVRRPVRFRRDGVFEDYGADSDNLILVSEGIAPYVGQSATSGGLVTGTKAVQTIEVSLSRNAAPASGGCGTRGGQAGGGPLGAGFDPCSNLTGGTSITNALGGAATGTGTELNPGQ